MDLATFLDHVDRLAPGAGYDAATRFEQMGVFHRLAVRRWLTDALEQPTDPEIIGQLASLGDAHRWLEGALASGEVLRADRAVGPGWSTRVRLRPVLESDLLPIFLASFDPSTGGSWRYRGRTVPADEFVATFADGVRAQFVVELVATGEAVGLVSAYDHNQAGLHCKVAFLRIGDRRTGDRGATIEGLVLLLSHLFSTFPYRKVFAEVPAFNRGLVDAGLAEEEGVLRDYFFHDGRPVDLHIVSFSRERWEQIHEELGW